MVLDLIFTYLTLGGLLTLIITILSSFPSTFQYKLTLKESIFTVILWPLVVRHMVEK